MSRRPSRRAFPSLEILEDRHLPAVLHPGYLVYSGGDFGPGTLRDAIDHLNAFRAELLKEHIDDMIPDHVTFDIGKGGHQTIHLLSPLPAITDYLVIDGSTQPGFAGTPLIELDGSHAGKDANGLVFTTTKDTVNSLVINHFAHAGIKLDSTLSVVFNCYIGTDSTGTVAEGNDVGVEIDHVGGNVIGAPVKALGNVISGNKTAGVVISTGIHDIVIGNHIGTDSSGTKAVPNGTGVVVNLGSLYNEIGPGNLISGNHSDGVDVWGGFTALNQVGGNFIGTDFTGTKVLKNGKNGVAIFDRAHDNAVGLDNVLIAAGGHHTTKGSLNLISGNGSDGVAIYDHAYRNVVEGNFIGTDVSGFLPLGNLGDGVHIYRGAYRNVIGGVGAVNRNIISANAGGVFLTLGTTPFSLSAVPFANEVYNNFIGTNVTGLAPLPNLGDGVFLSDAYGNAIGEPPLAPTETLADRRNVIAANLGNGVEMTSTGLPPLVLLTAGNDVCNNYIGTDMTGLKALPNLGNGVSISNEHNNIGVTYFGKPAGNVISGNLRDGVLISGKGAHDNHLYANLIGTAAAGSPLGNAHNGVHLTHFASKNFVGGVTAGGADPTKANTIAFNGGTTYPGDGVLIDSGDENAVRGNSIFFNANYGIELTGDGNDKVDTKLSVKVVSIGSDPMGGLLVTLVVYGPLSDASSAGYAIDLFANPVLDPSGHAQGKIFLGSALVTPSPGGHTVTVKVAAPRLGLVGLFTATATDLSNNTSEFSDPFAPLGPGA
jgi:hypothetical protein